MCHWIWLQLKSYTTDCLRCYPEVAYSTVCTVFHVLNKLSLLSLFTVVSLCVGAWQRVCVCLCVWLCRVPSIVFRGALERLMCWRVLAVTLKGAWAVAVCFLLPPGPHNLSLCVPGRTTPGTVYTLGAQWNTKACLYLVFKVHFSGFVCLH